MWINKENYILILLAGVFFSLLIYYRSIVYNLLNIFGCSALLLIIAVIFTSLFYNFFYIRRLIVFLIYIPINSAILNAYSLDFFKLVYPGGLVGASINKLLLLFLEPEHILIFLFILAWSLLIIFIDFSIKINIKLYDSYFITKLTCLLRLYINFIKNCTIKHKNKFLNKIGCISYKNEICNDDPFAILYSSYKQ